MFICNVILYVYVPRIIEVEPSVNINEGRGGDIVKVLDNRIIGKVDQRPRDRGEGGEEEDRIRLSGVGEVP